MKKIIIIFLFCLFSCVKIIDKPIYYNTKVDLVVQYKSDTIYYYRIIGFQGNLPIIDSVYFEKTFYLK